MEDFEELDTMWQDTPYVIVATEDLAIEVLPFYMLPAKHVAELYASRKHPDKFVTKIYSMIKIAMAYPEKFNEEVFSAPLSYEGLIGFLNEWSRISEIFRRYRNGEIDDDGDPVYKDKIDPLDIYEWRIFERIISEEEPTTELLIRYFCEHIKKIGKRHNELHPNDIIDKVVVTIRRKDEGTERAW